MIRGTLVCVYLALVFPSALDGPRRSAAHALDCSTHRFGLGVSDAERTGSVDESGIHVGHPDWCRWLLRRGWSLRWEDVKRLVPVGTSQGENGFIYIKTVGHGHRLLPQRLERFLTNSFRFFSQQTDLDTSSLIGRLTPPWTYQLLFSLALGNADDRSHLLHWHFN